MDHNTLTALLDKKPSSPFRSITDLDRLVSRSMAAAELLLGPCCHESPESTYGACDGGQPCQKTAVVLNVHTGEEYCLEHFEGVIVG